MQKHRFWQVIAIGFCLCGLFAAGMTAAQTPTEEATNDNCGFPADRIFTGTTSYTLSADCDLSANPASERTWTVNADANITIDGNGYKLIGGDRGSGFPFDDAAFLTISAQVGSNLTFRNIVLDTVRLLISGQLHTQNLTYSGARNHGIRVSGNADFECTLFEENYRKSGGTRLGSVLTSNRSLNDGAIRLFNTVFRDNKGGTAVVVSYDDAPITIEGCQSTNLNSPRIWYPSSPSDYINNMSTGICARSMGASTSGDLACPLDNSPTAIPKRAPSPTPLPTPTPAPTPTPTPDYIRYVVCPGDNLFRIAILFCVAPEAIVEMNLLAGDGSLLSVGQELIIPIEVGHDWVVDVVPYPSRADGSVVHIVGKGQTLGAIAFAYGIELADIVRMNNLSSEVITPGQELTVRNSNGS